MDLRKTPMELVSLWEQMLPSCYGELSRMANAKKEGVVGWPDFCMLPINAAYTYLANAVDDEMAAPMMASELTACWMWRQNKVMYAFDATLSEMLKAQAEDVQGTEILPSELLMHLPYPIMYIKAPSAFPGLDGFFFWLDYDVNNGNTELRLQWLSDDMQTSVARVLHLLPGENLQACIYDTMKTSAENVGTIPAFPADDMLRAAQPIIGALQFVLYLLSENSDVKENVQVRREAMALKKNKSRVNIKVEKPFVRTYDVGVRIGAEFRKYKRAEADTSQGATGRASSPSPHMRRGHWHHYWTGPLDGDRKLILKWTAPVFVGGAQNGNSDVVVHPVKEK